MELMESQLYITLFYLKVLSNHYLPDLKNKRLKFVYLFWLVVLTKKGSNCWFKATAVFRDFAFVILLDWVLSHGCHIMPSLVIFLFARNLVVFYLNESLVQSIRSQGFLNADTFADIWVILSSNEFYYIGLCAMSKPQFFRLPSAYNISTKLCIREMHLLVLQM